jgi:hypothetical protein
MSNDKSTIFESPTRQRIDLSKSYASIERNTGAKSPLKIMEYPLCEKLDLHSGERLTWACLNSTCKGNYKKYFRKTDVLQLVC